MSTEKDYRFDWEKTKFAWRSPEQRDSFFHDVHIRVITVQHDVLQELLDENEELYKEFVKRWRKRDMTSFLLAQDPEYDQWLSEVREVDEEK